MIGKEKIFSLLQPIIKKSPADQTEAVLINGSGGVSRYANSFIHQNMFETNSRVYFRVSLGKKIGVASCNSLTKESLNSALAKAIEIAKNQKDNPLFTGLPKKSAYKKVKTRSEERRVGKECRSRWS